MNPSRLFIQRPVATSLLMVAILLAGFVATITGAIMPGVASSLNVIFSQVNSVMIVGASS